MLAEETSEKILIPPVIMKIFEVWAKENESCDYEKGVIANDTFDEEGWRVVESIRKGEYN